MLEWNVTAQDFRRGRSARPVGYPFRTLLRLQGAAKRSKMGLTEISDTRQATRFG